MNKTLSLGAAAIALAATLTAPVAPASDGGCVPAPISPPPPSHYVPDDPLPEVRQSAGIRYLTGGVGSESAASMRAVRSGYPVAISFVYREGKKHQFTSGVGAVIEHPDGAPVLEVVTEGPYLFVDLPPGRYRLRARSTLGQPQHREFQVTPGRRTEFTVVWAPQP